MRKLMIVLAMSLGSQAIAQEVPSVLTDVDYDTVTLTTDSGEEFTAFIIEDDFKKLAKRIKSYKIDDTVKDGNIKFVFRKGDGFEFMETRSFKLKSVTVYKL